MSGNGNELPAGAPFRPHFRVRISILSKAHGGPSRGSMEFGPDGMTSLICNFPGFNGRQAVILRYRPDARIADGHAFEADCMDTGTGLLTDAFKPGQRLEVWSGRVLAHGEVRVIFTENWPLPPAK